MTFGGLVTAAVLLGLAAVLAISPPNGVSATWLSLHLALAAAAGTAVAAVMPFFTAALGRVAPARPVPRIGAIACIAGGALAVTAGVAGGAQPLAVAGGTAYLVGLALTAANTFLPLRSTLGLRLRAVPAAYAAALACVAVGTALATAMVAGWEPVATDWAVLKPAHAWLNVFGFLSVVIAATLIHLGPTVAGARIRPRRSATLALTGLVAGAPIVALGFAAGSDVTVRVGAVLEILGAAALVAHGIGVQRDRGRWTGDAGWHRLTGMSLLSGPTWFLVAVAIACVPILRLGAAPAAWSVAAIAVPLAIGWVGQVLVGSWTHLVPAIGPGDQAVHARQRARLGWGAAPRWAAWNLGVGLLVLDEALGLGSAGAMGAVAVAGSLLLSLGLLVTSVVVDPRTARSA